MFEAEIKRVSKNLCVFRPAACHHIHPPSVPIPQALPSLVVESKTRTLIYTNDHFPSQRPRFSDRARQASPPTSADQGIPALLGTKCPSEDFHIRPKLSPPCLRVHFLRRALKRALHTTLCCPATYCRVRRGRREHVRHVAISPTEDRRQRDLVLLRLWLETRDAVDDEHLGDLVGRGGCQARPVMGCRRVAAK